MKLANLESGKKEEIEEKVEIQRNRFFQIFFTMKLSSNDLLNLKTRIQGQFMKFKRSFENIFMALDEDLRVNSPQARPRPYRPAPLFNLDIRFIILSDCLSSR